MHAVIVKFKNWKMAFRKFGKFEKQSSKFWNIRKIGREQMNEARAVLFIFHLGWVEGWGCKSAYITYFAVITIDQCLSFVSLIYLNHA